MGMERTSFIYDLRCGTMQVLSFFTEGTEVLHGKLMGTNSLTRGVVVELWSPSTLLRECCFDLRNQKVGSQRTMMTGSAWWAHPSPLVVPHSSIFDIIIFGSSLLKVPMGSLKVVIRSC